MPAPQWRADARVIARLLAAPQRYEFFQAARLLAQSDASPRLRYRNRLSLAFPANDIENLTEDSAGAIRMTPAFIGLLGSQGVLPLHYSECLGRHERARSDGGPRAFLDLLSHRAVELFYAAWTAHRPDCMVTDDGHDGYLTMLCALAGAGYASVSAIRRETVARYAMQLRSRSVSAPLIAGLYAEYFKVRFVVEQLVGHWQMLEPVHQACLGTAQDAGQAAGQGPTQVKHDAARNGGRAANVALGAGVLLGARIYTCDARVRLRIGPLARAALEDFLPERSAALQLQAMLALHCGAGMTYEVHLIQQGCDVQGARLDGSRRLGIDAFLVDGTPQPDREERMYLLHT